jgi:hypothetical protein
VGFSVFKFSYVFFKCCSVNRANLQLFHLIYELFSVVLFLRFENIKSAKQRFLGINTYTFWVRQCF